MPEVFSRHPIYLSRSSFDTYASQPVASSHSDGYSCSCSNTAAQRGPVVEALAGKPCRRFRARKQACHTNQQIHRESPSCPPMNLMSGRVRVVLLSKATQQHISHHACMLSVQDDKQYDKCNACMLETLAVPSLKKHIHELLFLCRLLRAVLGQFV